MKTQLLVLLVLVAALITDSQAFSGIYGKRGLGKSVINQKNHSRNPFSLSKLFSAMPYHPAQNNCYFSFNITAASCVVFLYRVACKCTFTVFWGKNLFCVGWDSIFMCVTEYFDLFTRFCPAWLRSINFSSLHSILLYILFYPCFLLFFILQISFWWKNEGLGVDVASIALNLPSQNKKSPKPLVHVNTVAIVMLILDQVCALSVLGSRLKQF